MTSIEPGQVYTPRQGGPNIVITAPAGTYHPACGPAITGMARAINTTGHNPRWISPDTLETDYDLTEE